MDDHHIRANVFVEVLQGGDKLPSNIEHSTAWQRLPPPSLQQVRESAATQLLENYTDIQCIHYSSCNKSKYNTILFLLYHLA